MPLQKLVLKPGVNREGTSYANEDGFYVSEKVRFRSGYAEKIGGWVNIGTYTYEGIARSLWAWTSLSEEKLLGVGTTQKFYISYGTKYNDITPIRTTLPVSSIVTTLNNPDITVNVTNNEAVPGSFFTLTKAYGALNAAITNASTSITVSGVSGTFASTGTIQIDSEQITYSAISGPVSGVYTITVTSRGANSTTAAAHSAGATVISLEAIPVGGVNLQGQQQAIAVATNSVTINTTSYPTAATLATTNYAIFELNAGGSNYSTNVGWGYGAWGEPAWGAGTVVSTSVPIRLWSQTNYDETLIFAPRYGSIYWWTKDVNTFPRAITLNTQADSQVKVTTTAQWINGGSSIVVEDTTGIDTGSVATDGTGIPTGSYVSASWDYSTSVPLIDPSTGAAASLTNAVTTLAANINSTATTINLTSGTGFPASNGVILIGTEQIFYATRTVNQLTGCIRGYNGTTAATHNAGDTVYNYTPTTVTFSYAGRHIPVKTLVVTTTSQNAFTIAFGATPYDPGVFSTAANFDPLLIRWSDQDDPYEWVPETTNQSGEQRLSNGSVIVTVANTRQEVLIWTDTSLYSMQYLGPPYVWGVNLLMDNLSIASQNAAITVNSVTYWMGVDRFYMYTGKVDTLPCTLRQFIYGNINRSQLALICCGTNEGFNEIWWFYPSATSNINDRYVVFNHLENTWVYGTINRTAWLDTQLEQNPLGAFSTERTYLTKDLNPSDTTIFLNDSSSYPISGSVTIGSEVIPYASNNYNTNTLTGCTRVGGASSTLYVTKGDRSYTEALTVYEYNGFAYGYYYADNFGTTSPTPPVISLFGGVPVQGVFNYSINYAHQNVQLVFGGDVPQDSTMQMSINNGTTITYYTFSSAIYVPFNGDVTTFIWAVPAQAWSANPLGNVIIFAPITSVTYKTYTRVNYTPISNQLVFHESGYDQQYNLAQPAEPIEAYIESADFDIGDGLNFAYVWRIIPDMTFDGSTVTRPQCQLTVKVRQNSGSAYTVGSTDSQAVTRTATYPVEQYTGQVYVRVRGRQMAFRMASVDLGVFWQMGMMRIDVKPDGLR